MRPSVPPHAGPRAAVASCFVAAALLASACSGDPADPGEVVPGADTSEDARTDADAGSSDADAPPDAEPNDGAEDGESDGDEDAEDAPNGDAADGDAADGDTADGDAADGADAQDADTTDTTDATPDATPFEHLATRLERVLLPRLDVASVSFEARAGDRLVVHGAPAVFGTPTDFDLVLFGPSGRDELARSRSSDGGIARVPAANAWEIPEDGVWRIELQNGADEVDLVVVVACDGGGCTPDPFDDFDRDLVVDRDDNCIDVFNPLQSDADEDGLGDVCPPADPWGDDLDGEALALAIRAEWEDDHRSLGYDRARDELFTLIDATDGRIQCVYTRIFADVVPGTSRPDPDVMNTEHSWPQSQGAGSEPARSDLHHLFPTASGVNSRRGNLPYCEVGTREWSQEWEAEDGPDGAYSGRDVNVEAVRCFEPPRSHKGDLARAMVYFSAVYGFPIETRQAAWFEAWNAAWPPSPEARRRNHRVRFVQGSRNPFVDRPELVSRFLSP